jgi:hypothetical protein
MSIFLGAGISWAMARLAVHSPQESSSSLSESGGFGIFEIGFAGIFFGAGFAGILFGAGFSKALAFGAGVQLPQDSSSLSEYDILCLLCKKHCVL